MKSSLPVADSHDPKGLTEECLNSYRGYHAKIPCPMTGEHIAFKKQIIII
jgi:hypothetical protein